MKRFYTQKKHKKHKMQTSDFGTMALSQLMHLGRWCMILCAQAPELSQNYCGDNREGAIFSWLHIYYANIASVRSEHSVCHESLIITYMYLYLYIPTHQNRCFINARYMLILVDFWKSLGILHSFSKHFVTLSLLSPYPTWKNYPQGGLKKVSKKCLMTSYVVLYIMTMHVVYRCN